MTLHEAIIQVLKQKGKTMTKRETANELNRNSWYTKRDGSSITAFQIHGRTRNYSHLFNRDGSRASLNFNNLAQVASGDPSPSLPIAQVAQVAQVASVASVAQVAQVPDKQ